MEGIKKVYAAFTRLSSLVSCRTVGDAVHEYEVVFENERYFWIKKREGSETQVARMEKVHFYSDKQEAARRVLEALKGHINDLQGQLDRLRKLLEKA